MRCWLKEAAGKALARRTGIVYEAVMLDEKANIFKVRYLYGKHGRICGGHEREGECALPGEVSWYASVLLMLRSVRMYHEKSAEVIVVCFDPRRRTELYVEEWRLTLCM